MSNGTPIKVTEDPGLVKPTRRGRKPSHKPPSSSNSRFFMGGPDEQGRIKLTKEFPSEVEAQLESLKLDQPYHKVDSWKAVADLSQGSIAVEKQAVSLKT